MKEYQFEAFLISLDIAPDCEVLWKFFKARKDLGIDLACGLAELKEKKLTGFL